MDSKNAPKEASRVAVSNTLRGNILSGPGEAAVGERPGFFGEPLALNRSPRRGSIR
jgi:hypothetical protein